MNKKNLKYYCKNCEKLIGHQSTSYGLGRCISCSHKGERGMNMKCRMYKKGIFINKIKERHILCV